MDLLKDIFEDIIYYIQCMNASPQIVMCIIALTLIAVTIRIRFFNIQNFEAVKQKSSTINTENSAGKVQQIVENDTLEFDYIEKDNEDYRKRPVRVTLKYFDSDIVVERSKLIADYSNTES